MIFFFCFLFLFYVPTRQTIELCALTFDGNKRSTKDKSQKEEKKKERGYVCWHVFHFILHKEKQTKCFVRWQRKKSKGNFQQSKAFLSHVCTMQQHPSYCTLDPPICTTYFSHLQSFCYFFLGAFISFLLVFFCVSLSSLFPFVHLVVMPSYFKQLNVCLYVLVWHATNARTYEHMRNECHWCIMLHAITIASPCTSKIKEEKKTRIEVREVKKK